jgi:SAM-dependent methyltransferase
LHQHDAFVRGEADAWFRRNRAALTVESDLVLQLLDRCGLDGTAEVLEVGAANGYRLAALHRRHGCGVTAVEPSPSALADGRAQFPEIRYLQGVAHHLPDLEDGRFDLILVHFVMHWVDRAMLLRSVAEIDRVLKDGGHLVVGDFWPETPQRVKYHHLPNADVWTYKQDYPQLWLASNLYEEVASLTFDHGTRAVSDTVDPGHRGRVTLLRKSLQAGYRMAELPSGGKAAA